MSRLTDLMEDEVGGIRAARRGLSDLKMKSTMKRRRIVAAVEVMMSLVLEEIADEGDEAARSAGEAVDGDEDEASKGGDDVHLMLIVLSLRGDLKWYYW